MGNHTSRKTLVTIIILLVLAYLAYWFIQKGREEPLPSQEGIQDIDLSLGDENGDPLPQ